MEFKMESDCKLLTVHNVYRNCSDLICVSHGTLSFPPKICIGFHASEIVTFYAFWPFIYTTTVFWWLEKHKKTILIPSPCKLYKRKSVKMVTACIACLVYRHARLNVHVLRCLVLLYKVTLQLLVWHA